MGGAPGGPESSSRRPQRGQWARRAPERRRPSRARCRLCADLALSDEQAATLLGLADDLLRLCAGEGPRGAGAWLTGVPSVGTLERRARGCGWVGHPAAGRFKPRPRLLPAAAGGAPLADAQAALRAGLLARCRAGPAPGSGDLGADHVAAAAGLLAGTLLQHWALHGLLFAEEQGHELHREDLLVGLPGAALARWRLCVWRVWREGQSSCAATLMLPCHV
jgi:hypothetical protein